MLSLPPLSRMVRFTPSMDIVRVAVNVNEDYFLVQNVWQLIGEDINVPYKPSTMKLSFSGYAERDMLGRGSLERKTWLRGFQGNIYTPDEAYNTNQDY
jgi:hypothetical protein